MRKMLAMDGITSLSIKPLHMIVGVAFVASISFIGVIWSFVMEVLGNTIAGWASMTCIICFLGGILLIGIGILGIYW